MDDFDLQNYANRLQTGIENAMNETDKRSIRPIFRESYQKISNCYDNKTGTSEQIQNCVQQNSAKMQNCQTVVTNEINRFQTMVKRCLDNCADDSGGYNSSRDDPSVLAETKRCSMSCIDKMVLKIPDFQSKIEKDIYEISKR